MKHVNYKNHYDLTMAYKSLVSTALISKSHTRDNKWTQSIAIGSNDFVKRIKQDLSSIVRGRKIIKSEDCCKLRETQMVYGYSCKQKQQVNTVKWDIFADVMA